MPSYAVDSIRQPFTGTGIMEPVMEWVETPDGKRRPGDTQVRHQGTGMPLWAVEVLYIQSSFGRRSTVTAKVTVGHEDQPKVAPLTPIGFTGLQVEVRTNRSGGFMEYWTADGLMETGKASHPGNGGSRPTSGERAA